MGSFIQATAVVVFAAIGAWIAARQMVIANDRLQMDRFDRLYAKRVAVYEATRKVLAKTFQGGVSEEELHEYGLIALDAQFLFDDEMYRYLREIRQRIAELNLIEGYVTDDKLSTPKEYTNRKSEHSNWLIAQGDDSSGFAVKFRPFLVQEFAKRSWLLRWPA
jgi:hypothetical protein